MIIHAVIEQNVKDSTCKACKSRVRCHQDQHAMMLDFAKYFSMQYFAKYFSLQACIPDSTRRTCCSYRSGNAYLCWWFHVNTEYLPSCHARAGRQLHALKVDFASWPNIQACFFSRLPSRFAPSEAIGKASSEAIKASASQSVIGPLALMLLGAMAGWQVLPGLLAPWSCLKSRVSLGAGPQTSCSQYSRDPRSLHRGQREGV